MDALRQKILLQIKPAIIQRIESSVAWIWNNDKQDSLLAIAIKRVAQWLIVMFYSTFENRIMVHAGALTATTLLSLLPLVAVIIGVTQWSGVLDIELLRQTMSENFPEFNTLTVPVLDYLQKTNFSSLGLFGIATLLTIIISTMSKMERAFNEIWEVRKARPYWKKAVSYTGIFLFSTLLLSLSLMLLLRSSKNLLNLLPWLTPLFNSSLSYYFTTFIFFGLAFTTIFKFMPNTKVPYRAALIGGFVCGSFYLLAASLYFGLQFGVAKYNLIFSSLAAIPLTIIWIHISWVIMLVSAQLSFTVLHLSSFRLQTLSKMPSPGFVEENALKVVILVAAQNAKNKNTAINVSLLSTKLKLPISFLINLVNLLKSVKLLEGNPRDKLSTNFDIENTNIADLQNTLNDDNNIADDKNISHLDKLIKQYYLASKKKPDNCKSNPTISEIIKQI